MNNIILIGNLVNDPELSYVGELNKPTAKFRLAVNRNYKNKEGNIETDFINIVTWGRNAEICSQYLQKGNSVAIDGSLRIDHYISSTGENRYMTKVEANHIKFLNKNNSQNNNKQYNGSQIFEDESINKNNIEISDDEIPF